MRTGETEQMPRPICVVCVLTGNFAVTAALPLSGVLSLIIFVVLWWLILSFESRKRAFWITWTTAMRNKGADQLTQLINLCLLIYFHYIHIKQYFYRISNLELYSSVVPSGLCRIWLETFPRSFIFRSWCTSIILSMHTCTSWAKPNQILKQHTNFNHFDLFTFLMSDVGNARKL